MRRTRFESRLLSTLQYATTDSTTPDSDRSAWGNTAPQAEMPSMEGGKKRECGIGLLEEVETGFLLRELVNIILLDDSS